MVVGVIALVVCWIPFLGIVLAVIALLLSILGFRKVSHGKAANKGMAITGAITGGVALLGGALFTVGIIAFLGDGGFRSFTDCLEQARTLEEQDDCQRDFLQNFSH